MTTFFNLITDTSRCPISNTNLDECESIFVWELTVPSSKTQEIKERLHKNDFNLDPTFIHEVKHINLSSPLQIFNKIFTIYTIYRIYIK